MTRRGKRGKLKRRVSHSFHRAWESGKKRRIPTFPQRLRRLLPRHNFQDTPQKLREFLETFDFRNVTDDQELKEQVERARHLLGGTTTDAIRNTGELRVRVREGMTEIVQRLETMVSDRVGRKFRFSD